MKERLKLITQSLLFYGIIVILNLFLGAYQYLPRFEFYWLFLPLPESSGVLLLLLALARLRRWERRKSSGHLISRVVLIIFTALFLFLLVFIIIEAFYQHFYQRPFFMAENMHLTSGLFNMFFKTQIFTRSPVLAVTVAGLLLLPFLLLMLIFSRAVPRLEKYTEPRFFILVAAVLIISFIYTPGASAFERILSQFTVSPVSAEQAMAESPLALDPPREEITLIQEPEFAFPGIGDRNLHLFIVESYGMTIFSNPHHSRRLMEFYTAQAELLDQAGFSAVTGGYDSTTFGGTSWLADASILTGIKIDNQALYDRVIRDGTSNLLHLLEEKGYTTVLSAPGTSFMTSDYAGFYKFSRYILFDDFGYQGPYFTFGDMPDQYQLFFTHTEVLSREDFPQTPVYVQYILCSSHVPWNYIPPYIPSWEGFDSGRVYHNRSRNTWYDNSWVAGSELFEGYTHSIRYSLESVFGYIRTYLGEGDIAVIIGDHQPKFPVSEKDAGFGVPVHILARKADLLLSFKKLGYRDGLFPEKTGGLPGLELFLNHFLSAARGDPF